MGDYSFDLTPLIWMSAIGGIVVVGLIWLGVWLASDNSIRVSKPLKPTIELVINKDNKLKVDTVYVYKRP